MSSPTGDRLDREVLVGAQHHRHCLLGSTSSATPHHEWLLMDLGDLGPPQDVDTRMGLPREEVRNGGEQEQYQREEVEGDMGTCSELGEEGRHLFASPGGFLGCRQGGVRAVHARSCSLAM